jgi:hypothetical protein
MKPIMPSLVTIELPSSVERSSLAGCGNTAQTSDLMWMENELLLRNSNNAHNGINNNADVSTVGNDSTLSGSFLVAALEDMKELQKIANTDDQLFQQQEGILQSPCSQTLDESYFGNIVADTNLPAGVGDKKKKEEVEESRGSQTLDDSYFEAIFSRKSQQKGSASLALVDGSENEKADLSTRRHPKERKKGPMENKYELEYQKFVQDRISAFRSRNPNKLDYPQMSSPKREKEQIRVLKLLQRLHITSVVEEEEDAGAYDVSPHGPTKVPRGERESCSQDELLDHVDETFEKSINILSPNDEDTPVPPSLEKSVALLTTPRSSKSAVSFKKIDSDDFDSSSINSVEIARSAVQYDSPTMAQINKQIRKRMATTSGKRGADLARARMDDSSFESFDRFSAHETPSKTLETSIRHLSLDAKRVFTSSQSPISPSGSDIAIEAAMSPDEFSHTHISFGDEDDEKNRCTENETIEETIVQERKVHWKSNEGLLRDAPLNVSLKTGRTPFFRPLELQYNRKALRATPTQSFPDPLDGYVDRTRRRLERLIKWIRHRDVKTSSGGLILSLIDKQVIDTTLKLLLEAQSTQKPREDRDDSGDTLIVARSKEDLEEWGRSFREGSSLSVLNHSTLPLRERKTQATAAKCSQYDVVLTTFDAMKAPDSNVTVDEKGIASRERNEPEGGWYSSRSSSPNEEHECKRLSVLHQLHWRRVVFVDILGKRCYLVKPETSRATAARAFSSDTRCVCYLRCRMCPGVESLRGPSFSIRFIFVVGSSERSSSLTALVNSDKNALASVASVLQIDTDGAEETILQEALADFSETSETACRR